MGAILHMKRRLPSGNIVAEANDKFEIEKNDEVVGSAYNVPDLDYVPDSSKVILREPMHVAAVDIDDLTDTELRAILNDMDIESRTSYDNV